MASVMKVEYSVGRGVEYKGGKVDKRERGFTFLLGFVSIKRDTN